MVSTAIRKENHIIGLRIRVRGVVQGVGFRPAVWHLANQLQLSGQVLNDGEGVLIEVWGNRLVLDQFTKSLSEHCPPLARIDCLQQEAISGIPATSFRIVASQKTKVATAVVPDAATCSSCVNDITDLENRRYRYPFTNCTNCGPRFSIINSLPYDRVNTSMAAFKQCPACLQEYQNPANRRFHAQPNACPECGPHVWLEPSADSISALDELERTQILIKQGFIIAIKGIGGFHLACDATNEHAVLRLRESKHRFAKPFALLAKDISIIDQYCELNDKEVNLLESVEAPIVLLQRKPNNSLASSVAPNQRLLGFMLPYTPLHHLLLQGFEHPIVMTSGNLSDKPQCINNEAARHQLEGIADYCLMHNRDVLHRIDDSVVRVINNKLQILRRARGYAPYVIPLPPEFEQTQEILALGGELKNTFCLIKNGQAVLSQYIGDLENMDTLLDFEKNLGLYQNLYQHQPEFVAVDAHPEYISSKVGVKKAEAEQLSLIEVQHHHAHIAACLAENDWPITGEKVLGIVLDGLGFGEGNLWGGEFLLADYFSFERIASLKPVALLGGAKAMYEPWRNTYAHLFSAFGSERFLDEYQDLELVTFLKGQPIATLNAMLNKEINSPLASSCGRLFDAVAAAVGICRERSSYEGQAAIELEALIDDSTLKAEQNKGYCFSIITTNGTQVPHLDPNLMWQTLLTDLREKIEPEIIAARFHLGLANGIFEMAEYLSNNDLDRTIHNVVLSGGVFQNHILFELVEQKLRRAEYSVLCHSKIPGNDGGLALGQAVVALAQTMKWK